MTFRYTLSIEHDPLLKCWVVKVNLLGFPDEEGARELAEGMRENFAEEGMFRAVE